MRHVVFLLQACVVIFSLLAGAFWMSAATGTSVGPNSRPVPLAGRREHQAKWNAAAFSASIAAIAQAANFFIEYYILHPMLP